MKKVLVITYYWPPAGGPGVQRWLKFATYLGKFGIQPVLYIPENPAYPLEDASLIDEVPTNLPIYRRKIQEPMQWAGKWFGKKVKRISSGIISDQKPSAVESFLLWLRGNFFIPDARILWVRPSVRFLKGLLKKEEIDMVITTGPPHSIHLIGYRLKAETGVPWVADFRDPWTSIGYHEKLKLSSRARKKHLKLEKQVLSSADKILVTSSTTRKEFEQITTRPISVVTNGYEASDFDGPANQDQTKFTISHIGSLLSDRNPDGLWQALKEMTDEDPEFRNAFRLRLIGITGEDVKKRIIKFGLGEYLEIKDYLPHSHALEIMRSSQVLLLVEINSPETRGILPGKLFEYLASRRPILAVGPRGWEAADIIMETASGKAFEYQDSPEMKKSIQQWFRAFKQGNLNADSKGVEKYSRQERTRLLARELTWE